MGRLELRLGCPSEPKNSISSRIRSPSLGEHRLDGESIDNCKLRHLAVHIRGHCIVSHDQSLYLPPAMCV